MPKEGDPLHYRQLFGLLATTAEEELGTFLLAPAVPGSDRCRKNCGLYISRLFTGLSADQLSGMANSFAEMRSQAQSGQTKYGPFDHGENMLLCEAGSAVERVDWTLDNVFSVSSDEAFLKGVGL